jgi:hypothetical protein
MFKQWCQPYAHSRNLSHLLMDGGVLSIPSDKLLEFYEVYSQAYQADEKMYVVEVKTPTYNFFMDIDYKDDEALSVEQVQSIVQVICDKVGHPTAIISVGEPKPKDGKIKTGVHINWPGFVVDQNGAQNMMLHVVTTLNRVYPYRDWAWDIDGSVYKGSGFRLPWSHKMNKDRSIEGEYLPLFEYADSLIKELPDQTISVARLLTATIRTSETAIQNVPEAVLTCKPVKKEGAFTARELKNEVPHDSELLAKLEAFVRMNMMGQGSTKIQTVYDMKSKFIIKSNSRYCENIKKEHGSNHIKLIITKKTGLIHQECFCRCERAKPCKDFRGREYKLSSSIIILLKQLG